MTEQLEIIIKDVYLPVKNLDKDKKDLLPYVIQYLNYREIGLEHKSVIQLMQIEYLGIVQEDYL